MKKGFIKKLIANHYTVVDEKTHEDVICQARGKFRYMKVNEDSEFNKQITKRTKKRD